jgi:large subunit ribosomal protein L21
MPRLALLHASSGPRRAGNPAPEPSAGIPYRARARRSRPPPPPPAAAAAPAAAAPPAKSYAPDAVADTYAVVEIGGHQLVVEEGRWYDVNRLEAPPGAKIALGRVLALKSGGAFAVGRPYLEGAAVHAEVMEELKGPKVIVYKMKPKKHYRRTNGHRQPLTKVLITKIVPAPSA